MLSPGERDLDIDGKTSNYPKEESDFEDLLSQAAAQATASTVSADKYVGFKAR